MSKAQPISRRCFTAWILLLTLPPYLGCAVHKLKDVAPTEAKPDDRVVGVTTTSGHYVRFAKGGALHDGKVTATGQSPLDVAAERVRHAERGSNGNVVRIVTVDGEVLSLSPPGAALDAAGGIHATVRYAYEIPVTQVDRLWVERSTFAKGRTIALVALVGLVVAALLIPEEKPPPEPVSCPFVYSWDGRQYVLDAEPYGGATTRGLERDDYSELEHLRADGGAYRVLATNEVPETQFTNVAELLVADHPRGSRVAADEAGNIHVLSDLRPPLAAVDQDGGDIRPWLERTDALIWEPPAAPDSRGELRRQVVMTFPRPDGAVSVKLVANAATGFWGSQMIRAMLALHGRELEAWYAALDQNPGVRSLLHEWNLREELYALKVEVEEPTGWEVRGILPGGGPVLAEHRVIALDLSRVRGDLVRIRLRPPAGFWALNSFAVAYGPEPALPVVRVAPVEARDSSGASALADLLAADERYQVMPDIGDQVWLTFPEPPPRAGMERTVFLHSRGYYRVHLAEGGEPDRATLLRIASTPGAAARFAADRFGEWRGETARR